MEREASTKVCLILRSDDWVAIRIASAEPLGSYTLGLRLGGLNIGVGYALIVLAEPVAVEVGFDVVAFHTVGRGGYGPLIPCTYGNSYRRLLIA